MAWIRLREPALAITLVVLAVAAGASPVLAAGQTTDPAPAVETAIDPAALVALDRMGAYLRTLTAFQLEAARQREVVLDNGLKVQFAAATDLIARKPDRLWIKTSSDRQERHYLYDGKQFTLWAPRANLYATVPAPSTIAELADAIDERFGVEMPLVDLFRWGTEAASTTGITAAMVIGPSEIDGANCQHFAFRQSHLDWQVWIQDGDYPLPRKLVLTTTTDEARPQSQVILTWNLAPTFSDADFTFDPPAGAQRIVFAEVPAEDGASDKEN